MNMIISVLKRIYMKVQKNKNSLFAYKREEQENFLKKFREPKDDIERSYYQYCCQMELDKKLLYLLINLVSLPVLMMYFFKRNDEIEKIENKENIFISMNNSLKLIPKELTKVYGKCFQIKRYGEKFSKGDSQFFQKLLKRYPCSWHFLLKCLIKIRFYSYEISCHNPKTIVTVNEFSFTSSVLTAYCNAKGITHINVMHGEKLFYMRDSFFHFNKCYVWDEHYIKLFLKLRAQKEQFIIAKPDSLKFSNQSGVIKSIDYTYYLGGENKERMLKIYNILRILESKGKKIAVRPHPIYSNISEVEEIFKDFEIENAKIIDIDNSVTRTNNIISLYSTVLYQAVCNKFHIIIDDISNKELYEKLRELDYICLKKEYKLLSSIVRNVDI